MFIGIKVSNTYDAYKWLFYVFWIRLWKITKKITADEKIQVKGYVFGVLCIYKKNLDLLTNESYSYLFGFKFLSKKRKKDTTTLKFLNIPIYRNIEFACNKINNVSHKESTQYHAAKNEIEQKYMEMNLILKSFASGLRAAKRLENKK